MTTTRLALLVFAAVALASAASADPQSSWTSPPDSAIPDNAFGAMVRRGKAIFTETTANAGAYVGNGLTCSNCHRDAGRLANSAPLGPAYVLYPAYRTKDHHVDTYAERLRQCFRYSMNGKEPPLGDDVLVALEAYSYFLAKGAPVGIVLPGQGYPKLPKPAQAPDFARGAAAYAQKCQTCHGADGAGRKAGAQTIFPALWGSDSYNWGAGMTSLENAAGFIKANMPLGQGASLGDQEAWDLAAFIDGHERPQDPRFTGDVAETRKLFHDTPMSLYGESVNGVVLGAHSPPAGPHAK